MNFDPEWMEEDPAANARIVQLLCIAKHPAGLVKRRWPWMLLALLIGSAITTGLFLYIKPQYEAKSTVLVTSQQIPTEFVRSTVSGLDSLANINALMGEILSQSSLGQLIDEYQLYTEERSRLELSAIINLMRKNITIQAQHTLEGGGRTRRNETSKIFSIQFVSDQPQTAAGVANALAAGFIDSNIRRRNSQAHTTTEFMEREMTRSEKAFREAKAKMTAFQNLHRGVMLKDQETILRKLERMETRRQVLTVNLHDENDRLSIMRNREEIKSNPAAILADLRLSLAAGLSNHTNEHPNIVALRRRIEQVQNEMGEVKALLEESSESQGDSIIVLVRSVASLVQQLEYVSEQIEEFDARASEIPANAEQFEVLEQNARILEEPYLASLRKVHEAKLAEELEHSQQGPRVTLLDSAEAPVEPIRSPKIYLWRGILATTILALALAVMIELFDPVVLGSEHLEAICDAPVLGSIYSL